MSINKNPVHGQEGGLQLLKERYGVKIKVWHRGKQSRVFIERSEIEALIEELQGIEKQLYQEAGRS